MDAFRGVRRLKGVGVMSYLVMDCGLRAIILTGVQLNMYTNKVNYLQRYRFSKQR